MAVQQESESGLTTDSSSSYVRLHITPFNPNLLTTIIPASTLPSARNISYHSLQTFPEKAYGYVELPVMEADKLRKKLNGSILKGTKLRIENARPKKEITPTGEVEESVKEKKSSSRKRKRDPDTIQGAEIGDRHVKRGWTTPAAALKPEKRLKNKEKEKEKKKTVVKSKYTANPECLFKTVVPPNVAANVVDPTLTKAKSDKRKRSKKGKEVVVHEFAKTTKHATFLKSSIATSSSSKTAVEFVDGKGWVDEDGNMVEEVITKERKSVKVDKQESRGNTVGETNSTSESSPEEDSLSDKEETDGAKQDTSLELAEEDSETSSSGTSSDEEESDDKELKQAIGAGEDTSEESSDEDSSSEDSSSEDEIPAVETEMRKQSTSRPRSSSGTAPNLSIKIPPPIPSTPVASHAQSGATEVHPLEALFKKPRPDSNQPASEQPSFSFFGGDENDIEDDNDNQQNTVSQYQVPLTPFTQKDLEYRGLRSAAPTPDTAFPNKRFVWPSENEDQDEDEEAYEGSPSKGLKGRKGTDEKTETESDFQKWFYENRGDTNRAWKKRRKLAAKEKRQRENRKRTDRAV
ncbi:hypothetical protein F5884DRAFT_792620 [Xylogone sp. PMI_703]|nr:hypothetical protein F5884DRAFT_792620 [Xylogone sp. PMI_703]